MPPILFHAWGLLLCMTAGAASEASTAPASDYSYPDLVLITHTVRDAMDRAVRGHAARPPAYVPVVLRNRRARLSVTVRQLGHELLRHETGEGVLLNVAVEGGTAAGAALSERGPDFLDRCALEIEIILPSTRLSVGLTDEGKWSAELYASFDPGRDGVEVDLDGRTGRATPGLILAANFPADLALQYAESRIGLSAVIKRERPADVRYSRFRTVHFWQPAVGERPILLRRGVVPLAPDAVTAAELDAATAEIAAYLRYRQNRDGAYAFCYQPTTDRYDDRNAATAQMATLAACLEYGHRRPDAALHKAARRLADATRANLRPLPGNDEADYVSFEGHEDKLGTTAHYLLAILRSRNAAADAAARRIANALLATQDESGRIGVQDEPRQRAAGSPELSAALALLALAEYDQSVPDPRIPEAARRARRYYARQLPDVRDTAAHAAFARAFTRAYPRLRDPEVSDFVFSILDGLAGAQVPPDSPAGPELAGGIDLAGGPRLGADSALALAALADGIELARLVGDSARAERYDRAVRAAARFVLQLRFRPQECFYVRSERDVLGGVRAALWDNAVTIDNCARALLGLTRAREVLFGPWPAAASRPSAGR